MNYLEDKTFSKELPKDLKNNLSNTEFIDCVFEGINLSDMAIKGSKFIDCTFQQCNCSNSSFTNSSFRNSNFIDSKLVGINWSSTQTLVELKFENSLMDYSVFQDMKLSSAIFKNCSLKEVDFSQSDLSKASFSGSNLRHSSFTGADLSQANLTHAAEYSIDPNFTQIKKAKFSMPEAITLLKALDVIIE